MATGFNVPAKTFHGLGSFANLSSLEGTRAVIVTGQGSMQRSGYIAESRRLLAQNNISVFVFDGVEADPSIETVMRGADVMQAFQPDLIIGIGGCSAIDAAKIMWTFYEHPHLEFEDIIPPFSIPVMRKKAKFVAIPSTSGTGTEATCVAVITDRNKGTKYPIVSYEICPDVAIVDAELCLSMPSNVTANTGMDALTHALEAYVTPLADAYTDAFAERAVVDIFKSLPIAFKTGRDVHARQIMHDASCMAGMSFTNALLGIAHSMAHQVGGMFGVPHGRANAILLPHVIKFNALVVGEKYEQLARLVGETSVEGLSNKIKLLRKIVGIEDSFKNYGIDEKLWNLKVSEMAQHALEDACTTCNPRQPTKIDLETLLSLSYYNN